MIFTKEKLKWKYEDWKFVPFDQIEKEFREEQSIEDRFIIGIIVCKSNVMKTKHGNNFNLIAKHFTNKLAKSCR